MRRTWIPRCTHLNILTPHHTSVQYNNINIPKLASPTTSIIDKGLYNEQRENTKTYATSRTTLIQKESKTTVIDAARQKSRSINQNYSHNLNAGNAREHKIAPTPASALAPHPQVARSPMETYLRPDVVGLPNANTASHVAHLSSTSEAREHQVRPAFCAWIGIS